MRFGAPTDWRRVTGITARPYEDDSPAAVVGTTANINTKVRCIRGHQEAGAFADINKHQTHSRANVEYVVSQ